MEWDQFFPSWDYEPARGGKRLKQADQQAPVPDGLFAQKQICFRGGGVPNGSRGVPVALATG